MNRPTSQPPIIDRPVVVIGAGGHAQVLLDVILAQGGSVLFLTDMQTNLHGTSLLGIPIKGPDETILQLNSEEVLIANGIGSNKVPELRERIFSLWQANGYRFASIVHQQAIISANAVLHEGVQVMPGAIIQTGASIGKNAIVNTNSSVDHHTQIGEHCHVAPGATICGNVQIGPKSHIGCGSTIVEGIRIGKHAIVGAGAVVVADVPDHATVVGVPARVIRQRTE